MEPAFELCDPDLWGDITDADIFRTLAQLEQEQKQKQTGDIANQSAGQPAGTKDESTAAGQKRRFADCSEEELRKIELARHEKKTLDSTAWAVKLLKSKINFTKIWKCWLKATFQ